MRTCSSCGSALPNDLLDGHCPACLIQFTFGGANEDGPVLSPQAGRIFADYDLLGEVARGGMGVIYRARQRSLNRIVALKMLAAAPFASPEAIERFRIEARAAASLQHPNIVAIHEVGEWERQPYFTMDFVEGQNLAELVRSGPLSAEVAARYVEQVARAIHFAHENHVLHRDLKPSNVLIDSFNQPRVTDFGIAKRLDVNSATTLTGRALGSPSYMSPEQAASGHGKVGVGSDVYSLGALLYQLLTARAPFTAGTTMETLHQVLHNEPLSPRALNPSVPADLETVCLKCLQKEPYRRYASAEDLADELARFQRGEPIRARPVGRLEKMWRWCRRKPAVASLVAVVVGLLIALAAALSFAVWRIELARRAEFRQRERANQANTELARANHRLEDSVTILELQRAEQSFRSGDASMGLAQLAGVLRRDPSNQLVAERIVSALLHQNWVLPIGEALSHPSFVSSVAFSPSGHYLISGCADGFARIWNVHTRQPIGDGLPHPAHVRSVCFSPDETRVATACEDGNVRIWNWRTSELIVSPMPHEDWVFSVSFSPDGEWLASASRDQTARVWSARTGELRLTLRGHTRAVSRAVFSPDGRLIATAGYDGTARLWNADTGRQFGEPWRHPSSGHERMGVAFSPDGRRLATSSRDRTAVVWNLETGVPSLPPLRHQDGLNDIQFSPNGRLIATTGFDNTVRLWDAQSGRLLSQAFRHLEQVNQASFSPDGCVLATASDDRTVRFWDVRPGQMLEGQMQHTGTVNAVEFSRDGKWIATGSYDGTARIWDAETGIPVTGPLRHGRNVQSVSFSPDGRFVVTAGDTVAWIWEAKTGSRTKGPFVHAWGLWAASFSPDGRRLLTASADGTAKVWDIDSQQPIAPALRHTEQVLMARFSPDGTRVATASRDHTARVWDAVSGAPITASLAHIDAVLDARFSPDGLRVATASMDNTARIWDARTGEPMGRVLRHLRTVHAINFTRDGRRLVTASADHTARVWDAATGEPITPPLEHDDAIVDASFSPDDQRIVTASMDGSARVWDAGTGLPLSESLRHKNPVNVARFSPDGEKVATGAFARDYPACIWQVPVVHSPVPDWLPALADAVAGLTAGTQGTTIAISEADFDQLHKRLKALSADDIFSRVARWFFADRAARSVSPFQSVDVAQYVQRLIAEDMRAGLEETVRVDPSNALALARLARAILRSDASPADKADAAHLARLALRLDPNQAEAQEVLAHVESGKSPNGP